MGTIDENLRSWNTAYAWPKQGEEWSEAWGGSEAQWFGAIYPRIHSFLPASNVLEIGPGFGRWTHYLRDHCERLIGVDLADKCVEACRKRFAADSRLTFEVNDGHSLGMVPDKSVDFVFSFDTLVHAEADVIDAYLEQVGRKMRASGVGFIHHSNLGAYIDEFRRAESTPESERASLFHRDFLGPRHWRAESMTAELFAQLCARHGLRCRSQELVTWGTDSIMIDCFSVVARGNSSSEQTMLHENPDFMRDAEAIRRRAPLYSRRGEDACARPIPAPPGMDDQKSADLSAVLVRLRRILRIGR